jgi:hypothetical protein
MSSFKSRKSLTTATIGPWRSFLWYGQDDYFLEVITTLLSSHDGRHFHFGWIPAEALVALQSLLAVCEIDKNRFQVVNDDDALQGIDDSDHIDVIVAADARSDEQPWLARRASGSVWVTYGDWESSPLQHHEPLPAQQGSTLAKLARLVRRVSTTRMGEYSQQGEPTKNTARPTSPPEVICYALHVSHVFNLGTIPQRLQEKGWRVRWINAFSQRAFPVHQVDGIDYAFDVEPQYLKRLSSDLYLSPYVGQLETFPARARRVHLLVSLTSLDGVYEDWMFDGYDVVACAGRHQIGDFEKLGRKRGWAGKVFLPMGYPKLDGQRRQLAESSLAPPSEAFSVVFAPTHGYVANESFSILGRFGEPLVERMIAAGMNVVFRPHAESWRDQDRPVIDRIVQNFEKHPQFKLDRSSNYFESYAQTNAMITDISGTGFTYAFTFGRPAVFFSPSAESERGRSGIQFENREEIGVVVRDVEQAVSALRAIQGQPGSVAQRIARFRDDLIFEQGKSEQYFADNAENLIVKNKMSSWFGC